MNASTSSPSASDTRRGVIRWAIRSMLFALLFAALLFFASGEPGWGEAWVYIGIYAANQILLLFVLPRELLAERAANRQGIKRWDRLLAALGALYLPVAMYAVAGLDRRGAWTGRLPFPLWWAALALMVLSIALTSWAMASNKFFSGWVRIQKDRDHAVETGGPYRFVRHPGYVGGIVHHLVAPLVLGSLWALVPGALGALVLVVRTIMEDKTLRHELPGYAGYTRKTRYRLVPGIW